MVGSYRGIRFVPGTVTLRKGGERNGLPQCELVAVSPKGEEVVLDEAPLEGGVLAPDNLVNLRVAMNPLV